VAGYAGKGTIVEFYEKLAPVYDEMTRFRERLEPEQRVLETWARKYRWRAVLDTACGSGLHSVACARLGLEVVGVDISPAMIELARQHAAELGVQAQFLAAPMQDLPAYLPQPHTFDVVLCMGNSFPHLLTGHDCDQTLAGFDKLLNPGGTVIIQNINYDRVLAQQERVVAVNRAGEREFVRFYDFIPPLVRFNVLTVDWAKGKTAHALESTELYPYRADEMKRALAEAGFAEVNCYGDMKFSPFKPNGSVNLLMVGRKL
jgi:ubiquinone/menaquinone biosynthesis C-methylase UbiE